MNNLSDERGATSHDGKVLTGSHRIKVNGSRAARLYDWLSCPTYGENVIAESIGRIKDQDTTFVRDGNHTQCGAVLIVSTSGVRGALADAD